MFYNVLKVVQYNEGNTYIMLTVTLINKCFDFSKKVSINASMIKLMLYYKKLCTFGGKH